MMRKNAIIQDSENRYDFNRMKIRQICNPIDIVKVRLKYIKNKCRVIKVGSFKVDKKVRNLSRQKVIWT